MIPINKSKPETTYLWLLGKVEIAFDRVSIRPEVVDKFEVRLVPMKKTGAALFTGWIRTECNFALGETGRKQIAANAAPMAATSNLRHVFFMAQIL